MSRLKNTIFSTVPAAGNIEGARAHFVAAWRAFCALPLRHIPVPSRSFALGRGAHIQRHTVLHKKNMVRGTNHAMSEFLHAIVQLNGNVKAQMILPGVPYSCICMCIYIRTCVCYICIHANCTVDFCLVYLLHGSHKKFPIRGHCLFVVEACRPPAHGAGCDSAAHLRDSFSLGSALLHMMSASCGGRGLSANGVELPRRRHGSDVVRCTLQDGRIYHHWIQCGWHGSRTWVLRNHQSRAGKSAWGGFLPKLMQPRKCWRAENVLSNRPVGCLQFALRGNAFL